mmetsp:Transcript_10057/g.14747  ORF Transcript_10057/g.14747 Transcript_10057/m.14747 type:complete len:304 (-) Transcript_10057:316-1227(-)|eukprot:CAMPEP_0197238386 /NCGR_PEP_ID=MMETSP1429-20130617/4863_1 /TAXON_ID=49237 /ORGANISM="Chaetoceros  sp., Strain UNC1202" /LENGTH=303 /DNA_ID=CAMNT_0042697519 /DNA_START=77 /DNA_END=988 /DNA_ORIENTATION=+
MDPFGIKSISLALVIASFIAARGMKRKSLSPLGAVAAWVVGFLSVACGLRGFVLLMFYQIGTSATKYQRKFKQKLDGDANHSALRGPSQVLACSAISVACSLIHVVRYGEERPIDFEKAPHESTLACVVLAHHCTCLADTLASELGILSKSNPFLLTAPWKGTVHPGTNGGVTLVGFFWSAIGGLLMGLGTLLMDYLSGMDMKPSNTIAFASLCGLLGSILDSLLGATVQATYYDADEKLVYCSKEDAPKNVKHVHGLNLLSNAQVNLVSVFITSLLGGVVLGPIMFERDLLGGQVNFFMKRN